MDFEALWLLNHKVMTTFSQQSYTEELPAGGPENRAVASTPRTDEAVNRGDIWTVAFDELRPVVVLSGIDGGDLRCVVAVEPANEDITGLTVEVDLGLLGGVSIE